MPFAKTFSGLRFVVLTAAGLLLSTAALRADATYDYVGSGHKLGSSGAFVYATFTVPGSLPDEFSGVVTGITSYELGVTDPIGTPFFGPNAGPNEIQGTVIFNVSTNSSGQITDWDIMGQNSMVDYETCNEPALASSNGCGAGTGVSAFDFAQIDVHHAVTLVDTIDAPGAWTELVSAPEPFAFGISGVGVLAFVGLALRRKPRAA